MQENIYVIFLSRILWHVWDGHVHRSPTDRVYKIILWNKFGIVGNPLGHGHANFYTRELLFRKVTGVGVAPTPPPATSVLSGSPPSPGLINFSPCKKIIATRIFFNVDVARNSKEFILKGTHWNSLEFPRNSLESVKVSKEIFKVSMEATRSLSLTPAQNLWSHLYHLQLKYYHFKKCCGKSCNLNVVHETIGKIKFVSLQILCLVL